MKKAKKKKEEEEKEEEEAGNEVPLLLPLPLLLLLLLPVVERKGSVGTRWNGRLEWQSEKWKRRRRGTEKALKGRVHQAQNTATSSSRWTTEAQAETAETTHRLEED